MNASSATAPAAYVPRKAIAPLVVGAIGVVFGDIGTSPLYALKEAFSPEYGIPLSRTSVLGLLSLIVWSMFWVVAMKYLIVMMRADNNGEGGILALLALALREVKKTEPRLRWAVISIGIFGAAMFYGDSMITPAISVLSAVEGLEIATPAFSKYVIPITLGILTGLFVIQRHGTAKMGALFGPVTIVWFLAIAASGASHIVDNPEVLGALNPAHAVTFFELYPTQGFFVLGAVFLALTGGEALYADMGHFGKKPIRIAWFGLVMPALIINYFGQAAFVLSNPAGIKNPFYLMLPSWALMPMVVLATFATVIASQAVISGAFSVTRQAILLGYVPRLNIEHTSSKEIGQIYVPFINWSLYVAVVLLVLGFQSSDNLASAYGLAVAATMVIECLLAWVVARRIWKWNAPMTGLVIGSMLVIDLVFLASNATKIHHGGWFPMIMGLVIFTMLITWRRGRSLMFHRLSEQGIPLKPFLDSLRASPPTKVEGTAIFMTSSTTAVPHALLHNLKHNRVLHDKTVFLTIVTHDVPVVPAEDRVQYERLGEGFYRLEAWYGFKEQPDIDEILNSCRVRYGLGFDLMDTSFFLSRETVVPADMPGMARWRDHLFAWMSRNATRATDFFNIPTNRVVELGTHVEI
ncbi:Low affinity potassium transport system protein kup [Usitatibacter rugosus]|uniref:Probable potassium transport system protein Kup n=1 Tax=Usitatibacter rugosus TaxID=2732067 RepID=A0A6M4GYA7_9PROT|nr:potassium transporter Kup [Usitatibacter rugosus]QJR11898.1 Low affinity potassium transport system protein kup [Usitatibacter rugosus]